MVGGVSRDLHTAEVGESRTSRTVTHMSGMTNESATEAVVAREYDRLRAGRTLPQKPLPTIAAHGQHMGLAEPYRSVAAKISNSASDETSRRRITERHTVVRCSSTASQARASFQSRKTVCGETPSASAVSSTLSPPKNRSSITCARRGSRAGEPSSASSSAQMSAARSVPAPAARPSSTSADLDPLKGRRRA